MTALFEPKAEKPQWELIYDELHRLDVGDVLSYERLDEILGVDFRTHRGPIYKAAKVWGEERFRALAPVNNVGYRVVDAPEHEVLARQHHKRSRRSLARSRFTLQTTDRTRLTEEDRERFDAMELNVSRQQDMIRRLDSRVNKLEKAIAAARAEDTARRLKALEARVFKAKAS